MSLFSFQVTCPKSTRISQLTFSLLYLSLGPHLAAWPVCSWREPGLSWSPESASLIQQKRLLASDSVSQRVFPRPRVFGLA